MATQYVPNRGNTIMPAAGPQLYKTFQVAAPIRTHFRKAACAEAGCANYLNGWASLIDETSELGERQAYYIRRQSGRRFQEERTPAGTRFTFEPGQACFAADRHVVSLERPFLYVVRDGDWRGNPRGTRARTHANGLDWADDFAEHTDRLNDTLNGR